MIVAKPYHPGCSTKDEAFACSPGQGYKPQTIRCLRCFVVHGQKIPTIQLISVEYFFPQQTARQYLLQIFAILSKKCKLYTFILSLERVCSTRLENILTKCPNNNQPHAVPRLSTAICHVVFSGEKKHTCLVQGMHESQGKDDHQHHHDQGIDLPRVWPLSWLLGVEGVKGTQ